MRRPQGSCEHVRNALRERKSREGRVERLGDGGKRDTMDALRRASVLYTKRGVPGVSTPVRIDKCPGLPYRARQWTASCIVPFPVNRRLSDRSTKHHVIEHPSAPNIEWQIGRPRARRLSHRRLVVSARGAVCYATTFGASRAPTTCLGAFLGPTCYSRQGFHSVVRSDLNDMVL